jgi:hypothetical protein
VEEIVRLLDCEKTIERERERESHPKQPYLAFKKSLILHVGKKMTRFRKSRS